MFRPERRKETLGPSERWRACTTLVNYIDTEYIPPHPDVYCPSSGTWLGTGNPKRHVLNRTGTFSDQPRHSDLCLKFDWYYGCVCKPKPVKSPADKSHTPWALFPKEAWKGSAWAFCARTTCRCRWHVHLVRELPTQFIVCLVPCTPQLPLIGLVSPNFDLGLLGCRRES
jgi:hypothetical protein